MNGKLNRLTLSGYKSIRQMDLALGNMNVLVGANGAGKSNFVSFFDLVRSIVEINLQYMVTKRGGADSLLHYGSKTTNSLSITLHFEIEAQAKRYHARLEPNDQDNLFFALEQVPDRGDIKAGYIESIMATTYLEPINQEMKKIREFMETWRVYQFDDTTPSAKIRLSGDIDDNLFLRQYGENLAAFLFMLKNAHPAHYRRIVNEVQLIAPFFDDFVLSPEPVNPNKIKLRWKEKGSGMIFGPHQLSDGTLRMIALATVLLQPELPSVIVIDEPELGLHPFAIGVLADLLHAAANQTQVIISTQSPQLVNYFSIEDLIVVERRDGQSVFERKNKADFAVWLEDYSLGDLWDMNILGGRPTP